MRGDAHVRFGGTDRGDGPRDTRYRASARPYTCLPMRRGFLYLVAVMDWCSRRVLSYRLSNTLEADFCVDALNEALDRHGTPAIFNTDQGSQFTDVLIEHGVRISMDGRGRYLDSIFIERLWRSLKYECVYLNEFADGRELAQAIKTSMHFYNTSGLTRLLNTGPRRGILHQSPQGGLMKPTAQAVSRRRPVQGMGSTAD